MTVKIRMRRRKPKRGEKIRLLKVTLSDRYGRVRGNPYRILAIPEGFNLYSLAEAILDAFGFDLDHCFGFYDTVKWWADSKECYELFKDLEEDLVEPSRCGSVKKTRVDEVFTLGKKMLFLFDYGDEWHFIAKLEKIQPPERDARYPLIVKHVGEAPPQYE